LHSAAKAASKSYCAASPGFWFPAFPARMTGVVYTRRTQVFGFSIADDLEIFGQ